MKINKSLDIDLNILSPQKHIRIHEGDIDSVDILIGVSVDDQSIGLDGITIKYDATINNYLAEQDADGSVVDDKISIPVTRNMAATSGLLLIDVRMIQDDQILHTQTICATVEKAVVNGSTYIDFDKITINQRMNALETRMEHVEEIVENFDTSKLIVSANRPPSGAPPEVDVDLLKAGDTWIQQGDNIVYKLVEAQYNYQPAPEIEPYHNFIWQPLNNRYGVGKTDPPETVTYDRVDYLINDVTFSWFPVSEYLKGDQYSKIVGFDNPTYYICKSALSRAGVYTYTWREEGGSIDAYTKAETNELLSAKEDKSNKITAITSANRSSTAQYTTPKAVADFVGQVYTPEQYGAKGDGVTDDKSAIEAMLADVPNNALCVFYGNYYISAGITITRPVNITMYGKIVVAPTADFCMRISGHDVRRNTFRLNLETTSISGQWNGTYRTIGLDLYSTWENTFDVNACNFNVGVRLISGNLDCTYNKLFIRYIFNCKTAILLTGDSALLGGTTAQNTFVGGRIGASGDCLNHLDDSDTEDCYFPLNSELVGSRTNNNNNFVSVSFECGFAKDIEGKTNRAKINANYNYGTMIGCRFEGITSFYGSHYISLVGGYGFDNIPNKSGGYSAIGVNDVHVNGYTAPIKIARNGNSGNVIEVTNANGNKVWGLDSNGYSTNRAILLSPNEQTIIYPTSFMKLRGVSANNPTAALTALSNFEWGLSNYGFLVLKSSTGKGFVVQPIYTSAPSNPVTGTHALIDGKPMWFNGDEWVYANGDTAFSIPTKVSDLTNDAGYLTQHQDISGKVDKIEGKGLSTNDFTNAYKTKLDGIEAQANKTVVDSSLSASSTNPVQNKVIKAALDNIPQIPTDVSSFNNDAGYLTLSSLPIYNGGVQ